MNHYLATYIDLVQSIGFIFLYILVIVVLNRLFFDYKMNNVIEPVKLRVEE